VRHWKFLKIREEKLAGIIGRLGGKIELHCLLAKGNRLVGYLILDKQEATIIPKIKERGIIASLIKDEQVKEAHLIQAIERACIEHVNPLDKLIELAESLSEFNAKICLAVDTSFLMRGLLEYLKEKLEEKLKEKKLEEKGFSLSLFIPSMVLQELFTDFDDLIRSEELSAISGFPKFRSRLARRVLSYMMGTRGSRALKIQFGSGHILLPTGAKGMKYLPDLEILRQIREFSKESSDLVITATCDLGMAMIAEGPCCYIKPEKVSASFKKEGQEIVLPRKRIQQTLAELIVAFGLLLLKPEQGEPMLLSYSWKGIGRSDYARKLICLGVREVNELINWISLDKERGEGFLPSEKVPWRNLVENRGL